MSVCLSECSSVENYLQSCCSVCLSYQCPEGQAFWYSVCVCVRVWGVVKQVGSFSKRAPIVAGSRFQGAHPQRGAAGTPHRETSTGSPRMTSGWRSTSLPGPHPPVTSEDPSPRRPGSEPGSTGSWAGRCPPPSLVWSLPPRSHKTGEQIDGF